MAVNLLGDRDEPVARVAAGEPGIDMGEQAASVNTRHSEHAGLSSSADLVRPLHPPERHPLAQPGQSPLDKNRPQGAAAKEQDDSDEDSDGSSCFLYFDPNEDDQQWTEEEAKEFLDMNPPSQVETDEGDLVDWIFAFAPKETQCGEDLGLERRDLLGLQHSWDALQVCGPPITYPLIKKLAITHRCLSGKWIIRKPTGFHIDLTWERVFWGILRGQLGPSAKVSSLSQAQTKDNQQQHIICVYSSDFTDRADVEAMEGRIRKLGIFCHLYYKPDVFTYLGVYFKNKWKLRASIYVSCYDARRKCSTVVSTYDE